jgi:hypothetical protein
MLCIVFDKIKTACFRSLTMAWSYLLGLIGGAMQQIDSLAALVGDASFGQQVQNIIGADPKVIGKYMSVVAAITIASRLRGIVAAKPKSP